MITGLLSFQREAILHVRVRDVTGQEREFDALVDTGFNAWLTMPPNVISTLQLPWQRFGRGEMADGSESPKAIHVRSWIEQSRRLAGLP